MLAKTWGKNCVKHADESVLLAVILDITQRRKAEDDRERLLYLEQAARAKAEAVENRARFLAEDRRTLGLENLHGGTLVARTFLAERKPAVLADSSRQPHPEIHEIFSFRSFRGMKAHKK